MGGYKIEDISCCRGDTRERISAVVGVIQDRGYQLLWGEKRERMSAVVGNTIERK